MNGCKHFCIVNWLHEIVQQGKGSVMIIMMVTLCHPRAKTIFIARRVKAKLRRKSQVDLSSALPYTFVRLFAQKVHLAECDKSRKL